jgi:hypothetical protein
MRRRVCLGMMCRYVKGLCRHTQLIRSNVSIEPRNFICKRSLMHEDSVHPVNSSMIHSLVSLCHRNHAHRVRITAPALLQSNANLTQTFDVLRYRHGCEPCTTTPRTSALPISCPPSTIHSAQTLLPTQCLKPPNHPEKIANKFRTFERTRTFHRCSRVQHRYCNPITIGSRFLATSLICFTSLILYIRGSNETCSIERGTLGKWHDECSCQVVRAR